MPIHSCSITRRDTKDNGSHGFLSSDSKQNSRKAGKASNGLNGRISRMLHRANIASAAYAAQSRGNAPSQPSRRRSRVSSDRSSSSALSSEVPKTPVGVDELHEATQGNNVGSGFSVLGLNEALPSWRDHAEDGDESLQKKELPGWLYHTLASLDSGHPLKELACHEDNNLTSLDSQQRYTGNSEENMATNVVQADPEEEVFAFVAPNELSLSEENANAADTYGVSSHLIENQDTFKDSPQPTNQPIQPVHKSVHFLTPIKSPMNFDDELRFHPFNTPGPASKFSHHSPTYTINSRSLQPSIYTDDMDDLHPMFYEDSSDHPADLLNFITSDALDETNKMHSSNISIDAQTLLLKPFSTPGPVYRGLAPVYSSALFNENDSSLTESSSDDLRVSLDTPFPDSPGPLPLRATDFPPARSTEDASIIINTAPQAANVNPKDTWTENGAVSSGYRSAINVENTNQIENRNLSLSDSPGSLIQGLDLIPEIACLQNNDHDEDDNLLLRSSPYRLVSSGNQNKHHLSELPPGPEHTLVSGSAPAGVISAAFDASAVPSNQRRRRKESGIQAVDAESRRMDVDAGVAREGPVMGSGTSRPHSRFRPSMAKRKPVPGVSPPTKNRDRLGRRDQGKAPRGTQMNTKANTNEDTQGLGSERGVAVSALGSNYSDCGLGFELEVEPERPESNIIDVDVDAGVDIDETAIHPGETIEIISDSEAMMDPIEDWEDA